MVDSLGVDIIEVERIQAAVENWGRRFLDRIFTQREIQLCRSKANFFQSLAARFAAKEAFAKALGASWDAGIAWTDVEILADAKGKPKINLYRKAKTEVKNRKILLSLSHTKKNAAAVVILATESL